jgi:hypothetical protein
MIDLSEVDANSQETKATLGGGEVEFRKLSVV